jgi:hypothetical protein
MANLMPQRTGEKAELDMPEVDPVTGYPKEETEKDENVEKYNRLEERKAKSDQLQESLSSETGQMVLHKIQEHLLARVNVLINEDAECRVLKRLLVDMGITINIGEKAVESLMKIVMKRQTQ